MSDAAKHRNFDEEFPVKEVEPISFQLAGETFRTRTYLHPQVFMMELRGIKGAVELLRRTLIPDDVNRLNTLLEDPDSMISELAIDAAAAWVMRYLSGVEDRPTTSPATSGSGGDNNGTSSEVASISPVATD